MLSVYDISVLYNNYIISCYNSRNTYEYNILYLHVNVLKAPFDTINYSSSLSTII